MAGTNLYTYEALEPGHIRLLILSSGKPHDAIRCTIVQVALDRHAQFEALSYTWGSSLFDRRIQVDGSKTTLNVSANCFNALKRPRPKPRRTILTLGRAKPRVGRALWIDAICMNQADTRERNAQVQMMSKIYGTAERVKIYLGESGDDAADLAAQIRMELALTRREPDEQLTDYLRSLLERPWFSRVWTLQEIALAERSELIWCSEPFDWHAFQRLVRVHFGMAPTVPALAVSGRPELPALELLELMRNCGATDPRDKYTPSRA